jgi:hypothetical protein
MAAAAVQLLRNTPESNSLHAGFCNGTHDIGLPWLASLLATFQLHNECCLAWQAHKLLSPRILI